jgi:hypothetical protein
VEEESAVPLDWEQVKRRYGGGAKVQMMGGRTLDIVGADDEWIQIRSPLWKDSLARTDLEKAVRLVEVGTLTRYAVPSKKQPRSFAEEYRQHVADVRGSSVAYILRDLGYLE